MHPAALLLADARFPAGGHAHSSGVEAAVGDGRVHDEPSLRAYLVGRLWSGGLVDAALAVATRNCVLTCVDRAERLVVLRAHDVEADARCPAPPLRAASRRLGRQLVRAAARCWPGVLDEVAADVPVGLHQACAWGVVGAVAELDARTVAQVVVHHTLSTPGQAAVRLLGLDPFGVTAMIAALAPESEAVVDEVIAVADTPLSELPATTGVLVEIAAVEHAQWEIRMFTT
jgi:urease accessory protein